jgi:hypothetical protein
MPAIQDFPVPAGDAMDVTFTVDSSDGISLAGAHVLWQAYGAAFAVPLRSPVLILKDSDLTDSNGPEITVIPSPEQFVVHLSEEDTALAPGNYYHEAEVIDASGNHATVCQGTMTITLALI